MMRSRSPFKKTLAGFLFLCVSTFVLPSFAFEAGVGKADITPPLGTPLNGYGDRMGRGAVSVHDPVSARCLYLSDGQTSVFLVTADLCVINPELRARVLELAPREVPQENIILTATHTHSAQGGMMKTLVFRAVSGRFVPEVLEQTARGFADAMKNAYANRKPAAIGYGAGAQQGLSANRRIDNGPIDTQIGVLRVDDADGNPIAILANFAAHPTTVGGADQMSISADYPGFYYTTLEKLAGANCTAMFTNGAEGNQRPANPENKEGWARTESIGRLLAERVKEISNGITCVDAKLHMGRSTPELPRGMGDFLFPRTVLLQTLEINDLLMTFIPGEACVEIAQGLRQRALDRGYTTQFTVDLGNDFLAYFAPPEYYGHMYYETSMNFYGPFISEWFFREFTALMSRGQPEPPRAAPPAPQVEDLDGITRVTLKGTSYEIGYQRGTAFHDVLLSRYQSRVVEPVASGKMFPKAGYFASLSKYLDLEPYALLVFGIGVRPFLQNVPLNILEEVQGVSDAVATPFDAMWLVQSLPSLALQPDTDAFFRTAFCTMFASIGDRAGVDDLLVGRNLDWTEDNAQAADLAPVVIETQPAAGHRFLQVGFPWNIGVFSGMNDAGLVVCAERIEKLGTPPIDGAPVEFVLRETLETCGDFATALKLLQARTHLRGFHVLLAGFTEAGAKKTSEACVIEYGPTAVVRKPVKGFLLGVDPASIQVDDAARIRYARVAELLNLEHLIASNKIRDALRDKQPGQTGSSCILNESTRHSIVFEPKNRTLRVAVPTAPGVLGEYMTVSLQESGS